MAVNKNRARFPVTIAVGPHPFPSRTRKLRPPAPMVLGGQPPGRVGRRRDSRYRARAVAAARAFLRSTEAFGTPSEWGSGRARSHAAFQVDICPRHDRPLPSLYAAGFESLGKDQVRSTDMLVNMGPDSGRTGGSRQGRGDGPTPRARPKPHIDGPLVGRRPPLLQAVLVAAPVPVLEGGRPRTPAPGRTEVQPGVQRQRGAVASIGPHLDEVGRRLPPPSTVGPGRQGRERTHAQASSVAAPATPDEVPADEPTRVRTAITAGRDRRPRAELAGGPRSVPRPT